MIGKNSIVKINNPIDKGQIIEGLGSEIVKIIIMAAMA